ncbi:MAG: hypothetical protein HWD62_15890 [Cyclobacteriaceae bacterium]|nr:MAG: hypothetical protein HWD62_15890 [Cyclobacteriaceae bacterium]
MVEVFKTDVSRKNQANDIVTDLQREFPNLRINFDLSDCDRILRVEGQHILVEQIISWMREQNHACELLE